MPPLKTPAPVLALLEEQLAEIGVSLGAQVKALRELFRLFTADRGRLARYRYLDSPALRLAYVRYHLPLNVARATCILRDLLELRPELAATEEILDLGAGPGSASIATLLCLPGEQARTFLLTDRSRAALKLAVRLMARCASAAGMAAPRVKYRVQNLPELPVFPRRALVWLSLVLNELESRAGGGAEISRLFRRLEGKLRPGSIVIVIEPGLRAPGLRLLALHDELLAAGSWQVLAPCTHQKRCPLLRLSGRPWCHFHMRWEPGATVSRLAAPLGLARGEASFSYLVLERVERASRSAEKTQASEATEDVERARVIGDPMAVRGGRGGSYICRDGKRETLRKPPARARRGDRIRLKDQVTVEGRWPA